jgi:hypothetical protein
VDRIVVDTDDLGHNLNDNNLIMDSGDRITVAETYEPASSGIQTSLAWAADQATQPAAVFHERNLRQLQAVLPRDSN